MSRQRSAQACVCARAGEGEKVGNARQGWETLSRKCNRLGFASAVSVCNSTSLSQFKSGLCKGSFNCGGWLSGGRSSVQVQFHSEKLVPFPLGGSKHPTLTALGPWEGWGEELV